MDRQVANRLDDALSKLEKALDTPLIAGELPQWCEVAQVACTELRATHRKAVSEIHSVLLDDIIAEDPEQANRVEQLKQTDGELVQRTTALEKQFEKLCDAAAVVERDERRVADRLEALVQEGLQVVMDIRRQEVALETWHSEALKRDRGVVD